MAVSDTIMNDETKISNFSSEQKAELYSLGLSSALASDGEEYRTHLLLDLLGAKLPIAPEQLSILPAFLHAISRDLRSTAGETLGQLLQDRDTELSTIQQIRDYTKSIGKQAKAKHHYDVSLVLYYAAIAHALIHHGKKITKFSYQDLEHSFAQLCREEWIPPLLHHLYGLAQNTCQQKMKSQKDNS